MPSKWKKLSVLALLVCLSASAAVKIQVSLTPERIAACERFLAKKGFNLPAGAQITGIAISAEDWVCTSCDTTVKGLQANYPNEAAKCDNCGNPMEPDLGERYKASESKEAPKLTESQIDAALEMGANWACEFCGSGGNRDMIKGKVNNHCQHCGADRTDRSNHRNKNTVNDPVLLAKDEAKKNRLQPQPPVQQQVQQQVQNDESSQSKKPSRAKALIGAAVAAMVGSGVFAHVTLQDTEPMAKVTSARWIQTVRLEQFQPVLEKAERSNITESEPKMPVGGVGEKPGAKIIECNKSICTYETYRWIEIDSKVRRGEFASPIPTDSHWAQFKIPGNGRVMSNTRFDVDLEINQNGEVFEAEMRPKTIEEFKTLKPGADVKVHVDGFRSVKK